jgi:hypothetical protein
MDIVLDSSALSRIYELPPPDRSAVITGLRVLGRIHVTTVNVLEAAMHPDPNERAEIANRFDANAEIMEPSSFPSLMPLTAWKARWEPELPEPPTTP